MTWAKIHFFTGQPIFESANKVIDKKEIRKIATKPIAERYVKEFTTYNHLIVMLFAILEGSQSIREVILSLLASAHKLSHMGFKYQSNFIHKEADGTVDSVINF